MAVDTASLDRLFGVTLRPAIDLIAIHKKNTKVGRRVDDLSLNRGAVVFAVAAWQGYVENLTEAILVDVKPPSGDPAMGVYRLLAGRVRDQITRFNTPNAQNTLALFSVAGFDPLPAWALSFEWERQVSTRYGSMKSRRALTEADVKNEIDGWLQVRHKLAHGGRLQKDAERVTGSDRGVPQLQRADADRCVSFFKALVGATSKEARKTFP